jgi:hypothetical protein
MTSLLSGVSRRAFLRFGGLGVLSLKAKEQVAAQQAKVEATGKARRSCIFLMLTGGPGHLDTFDPKPLAPVEYRGPLQAIQTAVPGVLVSEALPKLAARLDRVAILRSLWHDAASIHETGLQLIQTGRLSRNGTTHPAMGSIVARLLGSRNHLPPYVVLPRLLGQTGVNTWQGQRAGHLGAEFDPFDLSMLAIRDPLEFWSSTSWSNISAWLSDELRSALKYHDEPEATRQAYGDSQFGRSCLLARRLIEQGSRFVTVNMFESLADQVTWDCHANGKWAPATVADYRDHPALGPTFDHVYGALLDDLDQRGLLNDTLVVAVGEFGRTPKLNDRGGRDHWPGVWSGLLAGGGIPGGQTIGSSDSRGTTPVDRPTTPAEFVATILQSLGLDLATKLETPGGNDLPLADRQPIGGLVMS